MGVGHGGSQPFIVKNKFPTNTSLGPAQILWIKRPKQRNLDMRFGLRSVRSLYRAGPLITVSSELARHMLDLVGVQEVRWEGSSTNPAGEYTFFYGKNQQLRGLSLLVIGCHT
jgi:hypothetical protein